jgi:hypothetical protein
VRAIQLGQYQQPGGDLSNIVRANNFDGFVKVTDTGSMYINNQVIATINSYGATID